MMTENEHRTKGGYTVLEQAIVVAIMTMLLAIAFVNHMHRSSEYLLDKASWELTTALRSTRMQAISECIPIEVTIDTGLNEYRVWRDSNANGVKDAGEDVASSLAYSKDLEITANTGKGVFEPKGTFTAATGYWALSLTAQDQPEHWLRVLPNGQVDRGEK